ncbi:MAG TPA: molybdopterin-dependent oxidoreductase [Methyloceanibacter sp.]|nr:molybdopterin-dependent oxidoreductase [Methyloceanibacter sp.]
MHGALHDSPVKTTCPYCGVGCGLLAKISSGGEVKIEGDPDHPANFGRICSKGSALPETLGRDGRLLYPEIGGRTASWDEALDLVAGRLSETVAAYGPDSVAFYVSGQFLTEDYYVANKLMKGFIGSANIDTNSRLCMASSVAGHRRAFGADVVPGTYRDLELADLVVLVGSNLAWCHPVLYQRLAAAKEARPELRVVLIDPRRTMTADIADLHLPIEADGDVALFSGLLAYLASEGHIDRTYVSAYTAGLEAALAAANSMSLKKAAELTGLASKDLERFYRWFAATEKVVTVYSQGVNQSARGTDKVNAIINCHLATGRIGRPGMGPFSVTGQPNAMGGREVGALANMLAAQMEIDNAEHRERVRRFWSAPRMAQKSGLKAVDLFRAVRDGRIKALWIMATNPVDSMPEAGLVEEALRACPFLVVSDVVRDTDTLRHAHVKLPAAGWGEKDGTVTNSERRISRQRSFLPSPGAARPDWWIMCEVAKRMGFAEAFTYGSPAEIFAEHAALSAFENNGTRAFDLGAFAGIDRASYDRMQPFQWPRPRPSAAAETRFFACGGFYTRDGKARIMAIEPVSQTTADPAFPFVLNTGRVRDQWHTMTRSGRSPRLSQHFAEPFVELHPDDAGAYGIADADLVRVSSAQGAIIVRALLSKRQRRATAFVPMHWTDQFAANARVDTLVTGITDPHSGQPALKHTRVKVGRFDAALYGFAVLRQKPSVLPGDYWALACCEGGFRLELAFTKKGIDASVLAASLFDAPAGTETLAYCDGATLRGRVACFDGDQLLGALFLAPEPVAVSRAWACEQLLAKHDDHRARMAVIAGRPGAGRIDRGALVCSCVGIGANQIAAAVARGCRTLEAVIQATGAGSNCGSCRPEIRRLITTNGGRVLASAEA